MVGSLPVLHSRLRRRVTLDGTVETRLGPLTFETGYPSNASVEKLYDTMDFQRACQPYVWGLPMLATDAFVRSFKADLGGEWGELIFGPEPPAKGSKVNWVKTVLREGWFTYFRFYAPTQPYFDKSWQQPDIEKVE